MLPLGSISAVPRVQSLDLIVFRGNECGFVDRPYSGPSCLKTQSTRQRELNQRRRRRQREHQKLNRFRMAKQQNNNFARASSLRASSPIWASEPRENARARGPCPSPLRRSLVRSRETRFARPNRKACSQANVHPPFCTLLCRRCTTST